MITLDLKKQFAELYKPSAKVSSFVEVPPLRFLMVDGTGDIGGATYQDAVQALYGLAYPTKFDAKKRLGVSYPVMPLEGLYWDPEDATELSSERAAALAWRLLIMLPDEVPAEFVEEVRAKVAAKKNLVRLPDVRVQTFSEGRSVQVMHVGPYADEAPTIKRLMTFAAQKGFSITGKHHEIYLGDPRKADPARLKTVLRYGVTRKR